MLASGFDWAPISVNDKQQAWQHEARVISRATYSAPCLKELGAVGALTQAGSGANSEVMSMGMDSMGMMQQRPKQTLNNL